MVGQFNEKGNFYYSNPLFLKNSTDEQLTFEYLKKLDPKTLIEWIRIYPPSEKIAKELIKHFVTTDAKDLKWRTKKITALIHSLPELQHISYCIQNEYYAALSNNENIHQAFCNMIDKLLEGIDIYQKVKIDNIKLELFTRQSLFNDAIRTNPTKGLPPSEIEQIEAIFKSAISPSSPPVSITEKAKISELRQKIEAKGQEDPFYLLSRDVNFARNTLLNYTKAHQLNS